MNPYSTALVKAPKRGSFDFSHSNQCGLAIGALTPTLVHQIFPGDEVKLSLEQVVRLAPMPVPTYVNMKMRHDFFFVPLRLLYGNDYLDKLFGAEPGVIERANATSLKTFFTKFSSWNLENLDVNEEPDPILNPDIIPDDKILHPIPGTLFDYLGYPVLSDRNNALSSEDLSKFARTPLLRYDSCIELSSTPTNLYQSRQIK